MASSSIVGVSSVLYQTPPVQTTTKFSLTPALSLPFSASKPKNLRWVSAAITTPNSVLSEEAFKGIAGDFSKGSFDEEFESEIEGSVISEDELDISKLGLPQRLVDSLAKRGIAQLFPIQRAVLVPALEGKDIIARAKTGTGKTLAFGIPILKRITEEDDKRGPQTRAGRLPRVLVLAPTRELAKQVEKEMKESAPYLNTVCVYGGVSYSAQQNSLSCGVDVVVGTPGRIIDLISSSSLKLGEIEFLVLDEADQMLAVGFEEAVEHILHSLPAQRQSMLFSATMPTWVKNLSRKYLNSPLIIDLVGEQDEKLAEGIKMYAISTTATSKRTILSDVIMVYAKGGKTIVFTQTKRDADEVSLALSSIISSEALHGDISQHQRERTLNGFRRGKFSVLVATDVAARGLDVPNVDLVVHYELPNNSETFVHRSGRTGRAGKLGTAILMYTSNQRRTVVSIERDVGCHFEYITPPSVEEILASSADQVVATLGGVHAECIEFFTPTAQKLLDEQGTGALAAALAHMSGFSQPPSSKSLLSHEQGWITLQLTRDPSVARGFMSARSVMGFLSDVCPAAADEIGKIELIADERVQGAVFDLPEEIAKQLLSQELPPGNSLSKITKLPAMQDDGPPSDYYGRFGRDRDLGGMGGRGSQGPRGYGKSQDFDFGDNDNSSFRRGGRSSSRPSNNWWSSNSRSSGDDSSSRWSSNSRSSGDDWLIGGGTRQSSRSSSSPSFGSRDFGSSNRSSGDDWLIGGGARQSSRSSSSPSFGSRDFGSSDRSSGDDWLIGGGARQSSRSSSSPSFGSRDFGSCDRSSGDDWLIGGGARQSSRSSSSPSFGSRDFGSCDRSSGDDWMIGGGARQSSRSSSSPSFGSGDFGSSDSVGGACIHCGNSGHKASECPIENLLPNLKRLQDF